MLGTIRALHAEVENELRTRLGDRRFTELLAALREVATTHPVHQAIEFHA